jgi:hypothetical protein
MRQFIEGICSKKDHVEDIYREYLVCVKRFEVSFEYTYFFGVINRYLQKKS